MESILFIWGAVSHCVGQAGLRLSIFLSQLLGCWGHIHTWPVFCSHCLCIHFGHRSTRWKVHPSVFLHLYSFSVGDSHWSASLTERIWKKIWFAAAIPVRFIHPSVHHLFGEGNCLIAIMSVRLHKDPRNETVAFDLKVKGGFATKS